MAGFTKRAIRNILAVVGVDFHFSRLYDEEEVGRGIDVEEFFSG